MDIKPNQKVLLIPAMLDAHFPLIKYAFASKKYFPVVMDVEAGIHDLGLKYVHNDLCYPSILIVGQILKTLKSGKYNPNRVVILEAQAGDACRGSNYIPMIRKALDDNGYSQIPVISLNVTGVEKKHRLPITLNVLRKAVAGAYYGDLLMLLRNQVMPYEVVKGRTQALYDKWMKHLCRDLDAGKHLSVRSLKDNFAHIVDDFSKIQKCERALIKVGVVGELYIKYCRLGNWNLEDYLRKLDCEYCINGMTWYALYYMDTHMLSEGGVAKTGIDAKAANVIFERLLDLQKTMVDEMRKKGFYAMDAYDVFKKRAKDYISFQNSIGDGWLIGAEFVNHSLNGYQSIICGQPFGCLPSHVCGRGLYPALRRRLPDTQYICVDYDASGTDTLVKSRIQMLLAFERDSEGMNEG